MLLASLDKFRYAKAPLPAPTPPKKRKHGQAKEDAKDHEGAVKVQILCKQCRVTNDSFRQESLAGFFIPQKPTKLQKPCAPDPLSEKVESVPAAVQPPEEENKGEVQLPEEENKEDENQPIEVEDDADLDEAVLSREEVLSHADEQSLEGEVLLCEKCRRPLQERRRGRGSRVKTVCPFITRLRGYQRVAKNSDVAFTLTDAEAIELMRNPCSGCGFKATEYGNGITRLALREEGVYKGMGPYTKENTATACSRCNLMKGYHSLETFTQICRHIATHKEMGDFGLFPESFVNNTSKRSRSSYLTATKTHSLTNEQFNAIVSQPCYYCGKESNPPKHYNGLDRLDSTVRVYKQGTCVSCCGTCNIAKWRFSEARFLAQCRKVAIFTRENSQEAPVDP